MPRPLQTPWIQNPEKICSLKLIINWVKNIYCNFIMWNADLIACWIWEGWIGISWVLSWIPMLVSIDIAKKNIICKLNVLFHLFLKILEDAEISTYFGLTASFSFVRIHVTQMLWRIAEAFTYAQYTNLHFMYTKEFAVNPKYVNISLLYVWILIFSIKW